MVQKALFLVLLVTAYAVEEPSDRQKETKNAVSEVLATAHKDAQGLVSPTEYGRLLLALMHRMRAFKKIIDWEEVVEDYVSGLEGRLDPAGIPEDLASGPFSRKIAQADHLSRKRRREL